MCLTAYVRFFRGKKIKSNHTDDVDVSKKLKYVTPGVTGLSSNTTEQPAECVHFPITGKTFSSVF